MAMTTILRKLLQAHPFRQIMADRSCYTHVPVMANEVIEAFSPLQDGKYLDMTFGAGGHSGKIASAAESAELYCLDRDPVAYERAIAFSHTTATKCHPLLGKFSEIEHLMKKAEIPKGSFDGVLIDAGCSSMQMDDPSRGFSISKDGPLDMRMDGERFPKQPTARDVLCSLSVQDLTKVFKVYGEEKYAKKIAQAVFDARFLLKSINTTGELADLISSVMESDKRTDKLQRPAHVATKVFQALRIFVNNELNELNYALEAAHSYLKPGGKLVVLTFHSLEDRIVKKQIMGPDLEDPISHNLSQKYKNSCTTWQKWEDIDKVFTKDWVPLYKHVVMPTEEEIASNPRSRSAKLRAAIKM